MADAALWPVQIMLLGAAVPVAIEAYKAKPPGFYALWAATALMVIGGVLAPVIASAKVAASLSALAANPSTWFILLAALFFVLRPYWQKGAGAYDDTALRGEMAETETAIEALAAAVAEQDRKVGGFAKGLAEVAKLVREGTEASRASLEAQERWRKTLTLDYEEVTSKVALLEEAIKVRVSTQDEFQVKMDTWVTNLQTTIRLGMRGVDQGFSALLDRERLLEMAYDITVVGDELAGPSHGKPLGDWKEWQAKFTAWNRTVDEWARLADKHRDGVVKRVFDTPRSEYKNKWGADYTFFPDHDSIDDYKTFCIISRNFHVERKNVDYVLMLAAFRSPSKKCRGDPNDEEDPMLTLPPPPEDYRD